jgi:hypothetical protein
MDTEGQAKLILARAARLHAEVKGPTDSSDSRSVEDHKKRLNELDSDVVTAILSINNTDPNA